MLAFAMAVLLVFEWSQKRDIQNNKTIQKDSLVSLVFQFDREYSNFSHMLELVPKDTKSLKQEALLLRFDLLQSRLLLLEDNPSIELLQRREEYMLAFPKIKALLAHTEALMQQQPLHKDALIDLQSDYAQLRADVRSLSMAANSEVQRLLEQQLDTMLVQSELIFGLTSAQLVFLLVAAVALGWRHVRHSVQQQLIEQQLEERVLQRTTELQRSNQALETTMSDLRAAQSQLVLSEKMASLGQLVSNIAHEINTPIGAVRSSGQTIQETVQDLILNLPELLARLDNTTQNLFVALISHTQGTDYVFNSREERALTRNLVSDMKDLQLEDVSFKARVMVNLRANAQIHQYLHLLQHAQSRSILNAANNIATVLHSSANIIAAVDKVSKVVFALKSYSRSDQAGLYVDVHLKEGLETILTIYQNHFKADMQLVRQYEDQPKVYCFPDEINQVWTNLVYNALQAMTFKGCLTLGLRTEGAYAVVQVSDTGPGIPEENRERIFEAFFTTKPAGEGSGLGLDIVKRVVEKHKGHITLQTELGVGTTFSVFLPLDARIKSD